MKRSIQALAMVAAVALWSGCVDDPAPPRPQADVIAIDGDGHRRHEQFFFDDDATAALAISALDGLVGAADGELAVEAIVTDGSGDPTWAQSTRCSRPDLEHVLAALRGERPLPTLYNVEPVVDTIVCYECGYGLCGLRPCVKCKEIACT